MRLYRVIHSRTCISVRMAFTLTSCSICMDRAIDILYSKGTVLWFLSRSRPTAPRYNPPLNFGAELFSLSFFWLPYPCQFHTVLVYLRSKRKEGEREKRGETHRLVGFLIPQHSINASFLYGDLYMYISIAQPSTFKVPCIEGAWGTGSGELMMAPNASKVV